MTSTTHVDSSAPVRAANFPTSAREDVCPLVLYARTAAPPTRLLTQSAPQLCANSPSDDSYWSSPRHCAAPAFVFYYTKKTCTERGKASITNW